MNRRPPLRLLNLLLVLTGFFATASQSNAQIVSSGPILYSLAAPADPVAPGQIVEFILTVSNTGSTSQTVQLNFTLPNFVTYSGFGPGGRATVFSQTIGVGQSLSSSLRLTVGSGSQAPPDGSNITLTLRDDARAASIGTIFLVSNPTIGPDFFSGAESVGSGFSYLPRFGYFKLLPQAGYVYHNDLGFLYYIDAKDGKGGVYFYDFATPPGAKSLGFFYTSPGFPFPYLYSFDLKVYLYYFPDPNHGSGFYTTGPRIFSRLDTGEILFQ